MTECHRPVMLPHNNTRDPSPLLLFESDMNMIHVFRSFRYVYVYMIDTGRMRRISSFSLSFFFFSLLLSTFRKDGSTLEDFGKITSRMHEEHCSREEIKKMENFIIICGSQNEWIRDRIKENFV